MTDLQTRVETLIHTFHDLSETQAAERRDRIETFLENVREPLRKAVRDRRLAAADFNVFEAAGIYSRELSHSHFLAELLNPDGTHGQGSLFLNSFLERVGIDKPKARAIVSTEYSIDEARRLDVLIRFGTQYLLAIENKVNAAEGEDQIKKYQEWLKQSERPYTLVFLTRDGRDPSTNDPAELPPKCLSYGDISRWIREAVKKLPCAATRLRATLDQYAECCAMLGGNRMCKLDEKLLEHLRQETYLETLFELEPYIREIRNKIIDDFVEKSLRAKLEAKDPDMELQGKLTSERYSFIRWRHPTWPKGAGICLAFEKNDLSELFAGFRAPNAEALDGMKKEEAAEYKLVDENMRKKIREATIPVTSLFGRDRPWPWWPVWQDLPPPLDNWQNTEALLMVAGVRPFENNQFFVDWVADEFMKIREAVRRILG